MDADPCPAGGTAVMDLLRAHLPLSLLVDLALVPDVASHELYEAEAGEHDWLPAGARSGRGALATGR